MERCSVTEDLNRHMAEEDKVSAKLCALEAKATEVEDKFTEMANGPDGISEAFYWLGGVFSEELMANAIGYLFGDGSNLAFEEAVAAKSQELLDADQHEPDAPDYD